MTYNNNETKIESVFSRKIRAGKKRTYFFDIRTTRSNDYFLTITESRKRFNDNGYDRHKIFVYKEDFNKFIKALCESVDYVKTDLMPDFDFDAFSHEGYEEGEMPTLPANSEMVEMASEVVMAEEKEELVESFVEPILSNENSAIAAIHVEAEEVDKW